MANTIRFILKENKKTSKGLYPIYMAITINRRVSFKSTGFKILHKYWDSRNELVKDAHPTAKEINDTMLALRKGALNKLLESSIANKPVSANAVKKSFSQRDTSNIFAFVESFKKEVSNKREASTVENYRKHLLRLELYHGSKNLSFEDLTPEYLTKYEHFLLDDKLSRNYVFILIRAIRTMFNAARKRNVTSYYPFTEYEMLSYSAPEKQYLSEKQLEDWKGFYFNANDEVLKETALWSWFGCVSGLRISDWYRFSNDREKFIQKDRLILHPKKKSKGFVSMPIVGQLQEVIAETELMPLTIAEATLNEKLKIIAKKLNIKKRLTSHSSRHHFACVQCLEKGISSETAAELMGITLDTFVNNYSEVTEKKIDTEVLRAWK